jgi:hypothetical protein
MRFFCAGGNSREDVGTLGGHQGVIGHLCQIVAEQKPVGRDADLLADRARDHLPVAGQDLDGDPSPAQASHGFARRRIGWIEEGGEAAQDEIALVVGRERRLVTRHRFPADGQHVVAAATKLVTGSLRYPQPIWCQRHRAGLRVHPRAPRQ